MIGVLMLNTGFPRLRGDIGNPDSFSAPVAFETVAPASVSNIVVNGMPDDQLIDAFIAAGNRLIDRGATTIGTSCGFLASVQGRIGAQLSVPFVSSSLVLLPLLKTVFGNEDSIGVLTFDSATLGQCHFPDSVDIPSAGISITGLPPSSHWYQCIKQDLNEVDVTIAKQDVLQIAQRCVENNPQTRALLLECTNLSPWKQALKTQSGLPVFDLVDALEWIDRSAT